MPILSTNKHAFFNYEVLEKYEAGIILAGYEVKAAKTGQIDLSGSYVNIKDNEVWLVNTHISYYQHKNTPVDYDPDQTRKLLLHKKEINALTTKVQTKGLTLVPLRVYTKLGKIKIEIGLVRGKKKYDKRQVIKERDNKRRIDRVMKNGDDRLR